MPILPESVLSPEALRFIRSFPKGTVRILIRAIREAQSGDPRDLNIIRAGVLPPPPPEGIDLKDRLVAGIPCRTYIPSAAPRAHVVCFHGGGWVLCGIHTVEHFCAELARAAEVTVTSVDYRLAPENPFPAAVEDSYAVTCAILAEEGASPVYLCGDSAGGGLAAVVASGSAGKLPRPLRGTILFYPAVDLTDRVYPSTRDYEEGFLLSSKEMDVFRECYLPPGTAPNDPCVSPLYADLSAFPDTLVINAACDILLDQGTEFVRRLQAANRPVRQLIYEGALHTFLTAPRHPLTFARALADTTAWLRK
ncbi:MAG: alpha/beta hydrolase [Kiritimatiellae bacterium]|nr:alpha/beta hydrolase [Kiritimatiellia bacterium]